MTSSRTEAPALVDVTMPQMGVSVAEGTVVSWAKQIGDVVQADETICEISTDKIDSEVPAPVAGVVAEILVPVDATVAVGVVLARIAADGDGAVAATTVGAVTTPAAAATATTAPVAPDGVPVSGASSGGAPDGVPVSGASGGGAPDGAPVGTPNPGREAGDGAQGTGPRHYSPVVQRVAGEHGIDLALVAGTGRGGRVRKQDVLAVVLAVREGAEPAAGPAAAPPLHIESPYRPEPVAATSQLSRIRRQIGEHMKRSLDIAAHCTTWIEVDMGRIEAARARLGVTALPFVARAAVAALREHPALNAWLEGERYTRHADVNLGIAVSLGEDGLIVPVVRRAHELPVEDLAVAITDLARRARARELTPDEVRGGTFTITNPGQYGSIMATPIINQPQVAILDLEAVVKHPVVVTDADGNDSIAIRPTTILGLSWDHRALDGVQSAKFLASLKRHLEGWTGAADGR